MLLRHATKSILATAIAAIVFTADANASTCSDLQSARTTWESNMNTYGRQWGEYINPANGRSADTLLEAVYYDGEWVFQQIGAYLRQSSPWDQYATWARQAYVDRYLVPNGYKSQGYRRFTHGPLNTFRNGGPITQAQLVSIRDNPSFSRLSEYQQEYTGTNQNISRELAYAIQANINAEKAGASRAMEGGRARVEVMVGWMDEHFKQWESGRFAANDPTPRFAPFMAALSAHALIEFVEWEEANGRDPNRVWPGSYAPTIEAALKKLYIWMRDSATVRTGQGAGQRMYVVTNGRHAFRYQDVGSSSDDVAPAYDLNSLLAYSYAWLARRYANGTSAEQAEARGLMATADELFIGNVRHGYISGQAKQFNQSYRLSFLYNDISKATPIGLCSSTTVKTPSAPSNAVVN